MDRDCAGDEDPSAIIMAAEKDALAGDIGLKFESGAQTRTGTNDDDGQSAFIGIAWEILHTGWLDKRRKLRELETRQQLRLDGIRSDTTADHLTCRRLAIQSYFSRRQLDVLTQRESLLIPFAETARQAYFQGSILYDELLKVQHELARTRQAQQHLAALINHLPEFDGNSREPEWLDLDLGGLLTAIERSTHRTETIRLEKALVRHRHGVWNDARLKLYARTGAEWETNEEDDYGRLTLGLRFDMPLRWPGDNTDALEDKRIDRKWQRIYEDQLWSMTREAASLVEALKDGRTQAYREQIAVERLRRELLRIQISPQPDDSLALARSLDQVLEIEFERLLVQERCYHRLIRLLTRSELDDPQQFVRPVSMPAEASRGRTGTRSLYQWSNDFNQRANDIILAFCRAKGVTRLFVSAGKKTNPAKLDALVSTARSQGLKVEWMGSTTEWLRLEKQSDLQRFASRAFAATGALHLDVEPQTLADYKTKKAHYWRLYARMLAAITAVKPPAATLSVALPLGLGADQIHPIASQADHITIMGYGVPSPKKLAGRLAPYLANVSTDRLTLALRPADFSSEVELEAYIDAIAKQTGLSAFALHAFTDYYRLTGTGF